MLYTCACSAMEANTQWHLLLVTMHSAVEKASGHRFNSLLCNLYRNCKDRIGWHSDEAVLGTQPTIASFSLGDMRLFSLCKQSLTPYGNAKYSQGYNLTEEEEGDYMYVERLRIPLTHGTLLMMEGATQDDWQVNPANQTQGHAPSTPYMSNTG
ncbi:alpha-ketoglutarate-dependent dioxygenase alkB homolog 3-like [Coregonus clupeaformis]|uniref:alpha-ketoglutarate-dependent dioxygenase alkB homolog 3-like n=1 Tax=Coregonus clupeaformis TaxID=59861 RepID=UPI001BDFA8A3|nr:alpha-ketoglutarate-dependent dioxygenase alkB homolog 3-like [Coregonus clupeaformis]